MAERIDHASEAVTLIRRVSGTRMTDGEATVSLMGAQAHATLALVEQQRIANLVSLAGLPGGEPGVSGEALALLSGEGAHSLAEWTPMPGVPDDEYVRIRPDIAAALGIEVGGDD